MNVNGDDQRETETDGMNLIANQRGRRLQRRCLYTDPVSTTPAVRMVLVRVEATPDCDDPDCEGECIEDPDRVWVFQAHSFPVVTILSRIEHQYIREDDGQRHPGGSNHAEML